MKKCFLIFAICFGAATYSSAQTSFGKGDNVVNLGASFGGNLYGGFTGGNLNRIPLVKLSYERCIIDNLFNDKSAIGVGGFGGYSSASYKYSDGDKWRMSNILLGAQGAFHYSFIDKLDTYAGVRGTYNIVSWKWHGLGEGLSSASNGLYFNAYVGARYYFTNSLAVFAEASHGYELLHAGVALKF
jgi:hypothetical protein